MSETERDELRRKHDDEPAPASAETDAETAEELPPEDDRLTELEEAAGHSLSDDLTREATRLEPPAKQDDTRQ